MSREPLERMDDTGLMIRVRWGDESAFEELYGRYYRRLLDFFYGMSGNTQTAEDLCHETFSRVWQVRRKYAATGSFPAYLFTFARNIWLEHCRRQGKQWRLGIRKTLEVGPGGAGHELMIPELGHPDQEASRSELAEEIGRAVDALPEDQRMVFVMRTMQGLSIADIAAIMQCPPNTVRSRKILAIKKLRESLRKLLVLKA
ncbi:MAG: sigma-70 family RNA polymerase sigma factor [bacterium]|nr:sigma-70 family RNA polymerase sigma factor [bacterium]